MQEALCECEQRTKSKMSSMTADASSVIRPDPSAADGAQETEAVPGDPMEIRTCRSGARMSLLRASPDVREAIQLTADHETQLPLQLHPLRSHHPCLHP